MKQKLSMAVIAMLSFAGAAHATPGTITSPTGGALPSGVTQVGGLVVDLKGTNGTRVVAQLAASQMYRGYSDFSENPVPGVASGNPLLFGTQTGFDSSVLSSLGGGLSSAAFRVTLYDGDSAPGNFDFHDNTFLVNGISVGDWSDVTTYFTDSTGTSLFSTGTGFGDDILSTGFFVLSDIGKLSSLFSSMSGGSLAYTLNDVDPTDNFYDFTQGVDGGLINVGTGPVVTPPSPPSGAVPEPATWAMMLVGFGALGVAMRKQRKPNLAVKFA